MVGADEHRVSIVSDGGSVSRKKSVSFSDSSFDHALFVERLIEGIIT